MRRHFRYAIDKRYLPVLLPFLLRPSRDGVTLTDDGFVATFGLVKITTRWMYYGVHYWYDCGCVWYWMLCADGYCSGEQDAASRQNMSGAPVPDHCCIQVGPNVQRRTGGGNVWMPG